MDRSNWYYKQLVTEGELNQAFDDVAETSLAIAQGVGWGVVSGLGVTPKSPATLHVTVAAGVALDQLGRRPVLGAPFDVDLTTQVPSTPTHHRLCHLYAVHASVDSDPRLDGNSVPLDYRTDDSATIELVVGAPGVTPSPPALQADKVLLAEVELDYGQTQIVAGDISQTIQHRHTAGAVPSGRLVAAGIEFDPAGSGAAISSAGRNISTSGGNIVTSGGDVNLSSGTGDGDIIAGDTSVAGVFKSVSTMGADTTNQRGFLYRDTQTEDLIEIAKWVSVHAAAWLPGWKAGVADPWEDSAISERWYLSANNGQARWRFNADATGSNTSAPLYVPLTLEHGSKISEARFDYRVETGGMDVGHSLSVTLYKQAFDGPEAATAIAGPASLNKPSPGIYHEVLTPGASQIVDNNEYFYFLGILDITVGSGTNAANDVLALYGARVKCLIREASGAY